MKIRLLAVLFIAIILVFSGCTTQSTENPESTKESTTETEEKTSEANAEEDEATEVVNRSPKAVIMCDETTGGINDVFNLSATKSSDPDGDQLAYEWTLPDGSKDNGNAISLSFDEFGEYEVILIVTDGELEDSGNIKITIENQPPIAEATQYFYDVKVGETISLSGEPSSDPEGDELTYEWTLPDGSIVEGQKAEYIPQDGGSFTITLLVSDGDKSDEKAIEVEVYEPIIFTGAGDAIVDVEKENTAMAVHIVGNSSSRHFAVKNYDINNNRIDLLVNTTDPYDGIRPLDFMSGEWTARFEVTATGSWSIELVPLKSLRVLTVPGIIEGNGDDVFVLNGGTPDTAKIIGNKNSRHFAVKSYGDDRDLLVNTTDPYEGEVLLDSSTVIIEVDCESSWSVEVFER